MQYLEFLLADTGVVLFDAFSKQFDVQDDFTASTIAFSLPRSEASDVTPGTFIKVRIDGVELETYFVTTGDTNDFVTEDGVFATAFTGNSIHEEFEDAVVLPSAWPNPTPSGHDFQNSTPGTIIQTLIARSQEQGFLTNITTGTFSGTHDSNGVTWPGMMDRSYTTGDTDLSAIQGLIDQGQIDAKMVGYDLQLYLVNTLDRTLSPDDVLFRVGQNCSEGSVQVDASEFYTDIFAIGDGDAVAMQTRPDLYGVLGRRRMRFAQYGGITDSDLINVLAGLELDQYDHIKEEHTYAVDPQTYTPFIDYNVHDLVPLDTGDGNLQTIRIKQISVTQSDDDGSFTVGVTLGDLLDDADEKLKNRLDAITGANAGGGSVPSDKTDDKNPPAATTSVTITDLDYLDSNNVRKVGAIVNWSPVTTNVDGTPADDIDHYEVQYRTGTSTPSGPPTSLAGARADSTWSSLFDRRGKSGTQDLCGITAGSTRLSSGLDLWVQNQVYMGTPNGLGASNITKVDNTLVRTNPSDLTSFEVFTGVTTTDLAVTVESGFTLSDYSVVLGAPFQANSKVYTPASVQRNVTAGISASKTAKPGLWMIQWNPSTLAREAVTAVSTTASAVWTDGTYVEGSYAYLLGHAGTSVSRYLARVALATPFATPTWSDGAGGWVTTPVVVSTNPLTAIKKIGTAYHALYTVSPYAAINEMTSANVYGPWTDTGVSVSAMPEATSTSPGTFPVFHSQFDSSDGFEMGYSLAPTVAVSNNIFSFSTKMIRGPRSASTPVGLDTATWSTITTSDTNQVIFSDNLPLSSFQAQVRTVDSGGLVSTWEQSAQVVLSGNESTILTTPSTPSAIGVFQGIRVFWAGTDSNANNPSPDWAAVEVHVSGDSADFVPSAATRSYTWTITSTIPKLWTADVLGLQAATTYWVKLIALGKGGTYSDPSGVATTQSNQLVNSDLPDKLITAANIADGSVNVENLNVAAWSEQLVPNADFSSDEWNSGIPYGWTAVSPLGTGVTSPTQESPSSMGGKYSWTHTVTPNNGRKYISQAVAVTPNDIYYYSGLIKTSRATTNIGITVLAGPTADSLTGALTGSVVAASTFPAASAPNAVVTAEDQAIIPDGMNFAALLLTVYADSGAADTVTVTFGATSFKHIVGTANIANASINSAKITDLEADKITSGELNASVLISTDGKIVAGDENAEHAELDNEGLRAYSVSDDGTLYQSSAFGTPDGNALEIIPSAGQPAVAAISSTGDIVGNSLTLSQDLSIQGTNLLGQYLDPTAQSGIVDTLSWGCVARADFKSIVSNITIAAGGSATPVGQFTTTLNPNRTYQIIMHWRGYLGAPSGATNANVGMTFYKEVAPNPSSDAADPTTSSPRVGRQSETFAPGNQGLDDTFTASFVTDDHGGQGALEYKFLLGLVATYQSFTPDSTSGTVSDDCWVVAIVDTGPTPDPSPVTAPGASTQKTYVSTWTAVNSKSWAASGQTYVPSGGGTSSMYIRQGDATVGSVNSQWFGAFSCSGNAGTGETTKTIAQALSGAVIQKAEVWIQITWSEQDTGQVEIRPLGANSVPSSMSAPGTSTNIVKHDFPARNSGFWLQVPTSWFNSGNNGCIIASPDWLFPNTNAQFGGATHPVLSYRPRVRLTYLR